MTDIYDLGLHDADRITNTLGGGLPAGSLVLLEGSSGSGKSVWAQRLAYGVCDEGNNVTYVSAEENARSFIKQMESLSYSVVGKLIKQEFLFLSANTDTESQQFHGDKETDGSTLIQNLIESETPWRSDVVFIDNFEELLLNDSRFDELISKGEGDHAMQTVRTFIESMTHKGKTVVICVNSDSIPSDALRPLKSFATVHLEFTQKTVSGSVRRAANVRRYKNMQSSVDDSISFSIRAGQGLSIENRTIA